MDFFERWLHVSPDGGSGTLELAYVLLVLLVAVAVTRARAVRRAGRGNTRTGRRRP